MAASDADASTLGAAPLALARLATCNLNQWALDFDGNLARIRQSIRAAKARGATYRLGPELEITGYGCEDHYLEADTFHHSWQSLATLLRGDDTSGILCDIGMPVLHRSVRYNCRVMCLDGRILLIRPKLFMADDGNYRETRYFTPWARADSAETSLETFTLPDVVRRLTGQATAPFGVALLDCQDATVANETCEELFTPLAPHIAATLDGADIVCNGSGSHHQLRKLNTRLDLMISATRKCGGGVYMYSNQQGCDGGRCYYDGSAMIVVNGSVVAQGSQFGVADVEMVVATVDLTAVRSARGAVSSRSQQATAAPSIPRVRVPFRLCGDSRTMAPTVAVHLPRYHSPWEEIGLGPAAWLWDYMRRSGAGGYFLPLSGGADSAASATIVGIMCHMAMDAARAGDEMVANDVRRVCGRKDEAGWLPESPQHLASFVLHTCYMGTVNSGEETRARAQKLAEQIGAHHQEMRIDGVTEALLQAFAALDPDMPRPRFEVHGGAPVEDLALQNIQARSRMVLAYLQAQLLPWARARRGTGGKGGFLLVLGSANVDEGLRGYMTKYDCSSADVNPIGAVSKLDLKRFLLWAAERYSFSALNDIVEAPPTAELRPLSGGDEDAPTAAAGAAGGAGGAAAEPTRASKRRRQDDSARSEGEAGPPRSGGKVVQTDEDDMGMSYAELERFGRLRKLEWVLHRCTGGCDAQRLSHRTNDDGRSRCGPLTMFQHLLHEWAHLDPLTVAGKVKHFFRMYAINRHKMTTLTPSYHAEEYSPDDNRFDLRPFLYPVAWKRQFADIDKLAAELVLLRDSERMEPPPTPVDGDALPAGSRAPAAGGALRAKM